ncbi:FACT complex subunit [Coniosporium uncinatum]|uniref:FACT complex subunit n=1 Tax=Coniosporium uncinatum TaxID=93489 RepID=A0ACC3D6Z4_9PEZI|nr:FACT complex subunit [Coniosporium uncinatum]
MTEEDLKAKYGDKVQHHYEAPISSIVAQLFRGMAGKKVIAPSKEYMSHHSQSGVKCAIKANEGHLFFMDKSFMFVPKPATYISFDNVASLTMSRVGGAVSASRTFDLTVTLKNGQGEHQFSNINREEQSNLEDFFKKKNLKLKNEMADDSGAILKAALMDEELASSEEEGGAAVRGSADEDDESVDEDFQEDSDSDVAEEYDSAHESAGSGSDDEMADANGDADGASDGEEDVAERPKKKPKTSK